MNLTLNDEERKICMTFINPKYPLGVRSISGIAQETKLSIDEVEEVLTNHGVVFARLYGRSDGKYQLKPIIFLLQYAPALGLEM